jgi:predicted dienelactone hydrolase
VIWIIHDQAFAAVGNERIHFHEGRVPMRIRFSFFAHVALFIFSAMSWAQSTAPSDVFFSVPPADAPELARRGAYQVGVRTLEIKHPGQVDILKFDKATGKAPLYDRPLTIEVWYPAVIPAGQQERTVYQMGVPGNSEGAEAKTAPILGKALRDAPPVKGQAFPLVVVSHGYPGSRIFLSYLTENLASKGYVVAAIDHTDSVLGDVKPFPSTLLNRASDQLFTMATVEEMSHRAGDFLNGLVDSSRTAIVGFSMGGYGALASGGAGYSKKGLPASVVPGGYLEDWMAGSDKYQAQLRKEVKAIVAISPWGAQPPFNAWDADGLAGIRVPLLVIAGDQDDVADFPNGIKPAFDKMVHADRCLLVYENARHNVGGNPPTAELSSTFAMQEYFNDPVWRKDRITAINQHFVTAFLDLNLKGDETRRAYLHPGPEKSNDGKWLLPPGESADGKFGDGSAYWKGFQRRWALGLEMHCSAAER